MVLFAVAFLAGVWFGSKLAGRSHAADRQRVLADRARLEDELANAERRVVEYDRRTKATLTDAATLRQDVAAANAQLARTTQELTQALADASRANEAQRAQAAKAVEAERQLHLANAQLQEVTAVASTHSATIKEQDRIIKEREKQLTTAKTATSPTAIKLPEDPTAYPTRPDPANDRNWKAISFKLGQGLSAEDVVRFVGQPTRVDLDPERREVLWVYEIGKDTHELRLRDGKVVQTGSRTGPRN